MCFNFISVKLIAPRRINCGEFKLFYFISMKINYQFVSRSLIALLFVVAGYQKLMGFAGIVGYVGSLGVPLPVIATILVNLDEEPEKIRYAIMTYMMKVLLGNNQTDRAAQIIDLFKDSVMYSGKPGLVVSCYLATKI